MLRNGFYPAPVVTMVSVSLDGKWCAFPQQVRATQQSFQCVIYFANEQRVAQRNRRKSSLKIKALLEIKYHIY